MKPSPDPSQHDRNIRITRVRYENRRRLQMLAEKYGLSPEQQAMVYPVVARAAPSYEDDLAGDVLSAGTSTDPLGSGTAEANSDDGILQLAGDIPSSRARSASPSGKTATVDPFEAAVQASLDELEARLAPYLTSEQLAMMTEEQIDRYYWWGEILIQLNGDAELEAAILEAALQPTAASPDTTGATAATETGAAVPAAHLGGNLLDLLGNTP